MRLQVPALFSQRDSRWASILLGYNSNLPYTIGNYGCLITSFGMYINNDPKAVNTILVNGQGYQAGGGLFLWNKSSLLGLNQIYISPRYSGPVTSQGVVKAKELLDQGLPLICEVDFNPSTQSEEQHYVLVMGYENDDFFAYDPWSGTAISMNVYGGFTRAALQFRAYDKKLDKDGGMDLQKELDKMREERDENHKKLIRVAEKLGVETNIDVILADLDKLIGLEGRLVEKDKQLDEAKRSVEALEVKIKELDDANKVIALENAESQKKLEEQGATIEEQKTAISGLTEDIQKLKENVKLPTFTGFKLFIVKLLANLP